MALGILVRVGGQVSMTYSPAICWEQESLLVTADDAVAAPNQLDRLVHRQIQTRSKLRDRDAHAPVHLRDKWKHKEV